MKRTSILTIAMFIALCSYGQSADFSGSWKFQEQESISGNLYSNGSPKAIRISQSAKELAFDQTYPGTAGDISVKTNFVDGKPFDVLSTTSKRKRSVSISWAADGKSFTLLTHQFKDEAGKELFHVITDTYSMEYGNLILTRKDENKENGEIWESKAIYTK